MDLRPEQTMRRDPDSQSVQIENEHKRDDTLPDDVAPAAVVIPVASTRADLPPSEVIPRPELKTHGSVLERVQWVAGSPSTKRRARGDSHATTRVNICRNGRSDERAVIIVPDSITELLAMASGRLGMKQAATKLWNSEGFPILRTEHIFHDETLFVGASHEDFFGFGKPLFRRLCDACCACRRKSRASDDSSLDPHTIELEPTLHKAQSISATSIKHRIFRRSSDDAHLGVDMPPHISTGASPKKLESRSASITVEPILAHANNSQQVLRRISAVNLPPYKSNAKSNGASLKLDSPAHSPTSKSPPPSPNGSYMTRFWADPDFDISAQYLAQLFDLMDPTNDGHITYQEFREGLQDQGFSDFSDFEFEQLVRGIDIDGSSNITKSEFVQCIQALAMMSRQCVDVPHSEQLIELFMYNYGSKSFTLRSTRSEEGKLDPQEFFIHEPNDHVMEGDPRDNRVQWIGLSGRHFQTLQSLANRFKLSHLDIEDAMRTTERIKLVRIDDSRMQIVTRILQIANHGKMHLVDEQLTIFLIGSTVITVKSSEIDPITFPIKKRIADNVSKIRSSDANFLVYALLDGVVDTASSALQRLYVELSRVERKIHRSKFRTSSELLEKVYRIHREVSMTIDWTKPMEKLVSQLAQAQHLAALRVYYHDVLDHVEEINERAQRMLRLCESLQEFHRNLQSERQNNVVYILTLVTTVFVPAQFLTGLYGMNFDNMPELHLTYGYVYWWIFVILFTMVVLCSFRRRQWL